MAQTLSSTRFADFFFQVGLHPDADLREKIIPDDGDTTDAAPARGGGGGGHGHSGLGVEEDGDSSDASAPKRSSLFTKGEGVPPGKRSKHPLDNAFDAEVLCRYPEGDHPDGTKFPSFLPMFCYPNHFRLAVQDRDVLHDRYHSFLITEDMGQKCYGVCVTFYERLSVKHGTQLSQMISEWRDENLADTDLEYIRQIQNQLAASQESVSKARESWTDGGEGSSPRRAPGGAGTTGTTHGSSFFETDSEASAESPLAKPWPLHGQTSDLTGAASSMETQSLQDAEERLGMYNAILRPLNETLMLDTETILVPRTMGVLSRWPWYDFLKDWLFEVLRVTRGAYVLDCVDKHDQAAYEARHPLLFLPLERYVTHLMHEIAVPPPGRLEITVNVGQLTLHLSRPPVNAAAVLKNFSLYPIFSTLSLESIVTLFELILLETKIVFCSDSLAMLNIAAETFCVLMYPLTWQHILIPVLPVRLLTYLQAPMPYIVGIHSSYLEKAEIPSDAVLVDLRSATFQLPQDVQATYVPLPAHERKKLISRLQKYTTLTMPAAAPAAHGLPGGGPITPTVGGLNASSSHMAMHLSEMPHVTPQSRRNSTASSKHHVQRISPLSIRSHDSNEASSMDMPGPYEALQTCTLDGRRFVSCSRSVLAAVTPSPVLKDGMGDGYGMASQPLGMAKLHPGLDGNDKPTTLAGAGRGGSFFRRGAQPNADKTASAATHMSVPRNHHLTSPASTLTMVPEGGSSYSPYHEGGLGLLAVAPPVDRHCEMAFRRTSQPVLDHAPSSSAASAVSSSGGALTRAAPSTTTLESTSASKLLSPAPKPAAGRWSPDRLGASAAAGASGVGGSSNGNSSGSVAGAVVTMASRASLLPAAHPSSSLPVASYLGTESPRSAGSHNSIASSNPFTAVAVEANETASCGANTSTASALATPGSGTQTAGSNSAGSSTMALTSSSSPSAALGLPRIAGARPRHLHLDRPRPTGGGGVSRQGSMMSISTSLASPPLSLVPAPYALTSLGHPTYPQAMRRAGHGLLAVRYHVERGGLSPDSLFSLASSSTDREPREESIKDGKVGFPGYSGSGGNGAPSLFSERKGPRPLPQQFNYGNSVCHVAAPVICDLCCDRTTPIAAVHGDVASAAGAVQLMYKCEVCRIHMHSECVPLLDQCPCSALFDEGKIQQSFLKVFTALLKNYRQYLSVPEVYRHALREKELRNEAMGISSSHRSLLNLGEIAILPEDWFRKEEFLASGIDREARPFMTVLAATQSFAQFTLDRMERPGDDYEVLFFNEMLSAKRNRSLLRFSKTDTPFLNDESFRASQTVACMDPDVADLGLGTEQPKYVLGSIAPTLDPRLMSKPRPIKPLMTSSDIRMMKTHTNDLMQRATTATAIKQKQDFGRWMKSKVSTFQRIGNGQVVAIGGFMSDEQRQEQFQELATSVSTVLRQYQSLHLASQTREQIEQALQELHRQNRVLIHATDEEQLVDDANQAELQSLLMQLVRIISIYEDHLASIPASEPESISTGFHNVVHGSSVSTTMFDGSPHGSHQPPSLLLAAAVGAVTYGTGAAVVGGSSAGATYPTPLGVIHRPFRPVPALPESPTADAALSALAPEEPVFSGTGLGAAAIAAAVSAAASPPRSPPPRPVTVLATASAPPLAPGNADAIAAAVVAAASPPRMPPPRPSPATFARYSVLPHGAGSPRALATTGGDPTTDAPLPARPLSVGGPSARRVRERAQTEGAPAATATASTTGSWNGASGTRLASAPSAHAVSSWLPAPFTATTTTTAAVLVSEAAATTAESLGPPAPWNYQTISSLSFEGMVDLITQGDESASAAAPLAASSTAAAASSSLAGRQERARVAPAVHTLQSLERLSHSAPRQGSPLAGWAKPGAAPGTDPASRQTSGSTIPTVQGNQPSRD